VSIGPFQILIIALVLLVLFGRSRISEMMGDVGKGVTSFRKGLSEDQAPSAAGQLEAAASRAQVAERAGERTAG
jgi:sec-independent protein translocase protein TatA